MYEPRTDASGCVNGTKAGYTLRDKPFDDSFAMPISLILYPNSLPKEISSVSMLVIPSTVTSSKNIRRLKLMDAKIASLRAASNPSTSAVGSASA